MNQDCSLCIYDVEAKYENTENLADEEINSLPKIVPDFGFRFDSDARIFSDALHSALYYFMNVDPNTAITLISLDVYTDDKWYSPSRQNKSFDELTEPFTSEQLLVSYFLGTIVDPNSEISFTIPDIPNFPKSYLYVAGVVSYSMYGNPPETLTFIHGHEEVLPYEVSDLNE